MAKKQIFLLDVIHMYVTSNGGLFIQKFRQTLLQFLQRWKVRFSGFFFFLIFSRETEGKWKNRTSMEFVWNLFCDDEVWHSVSVV
jgi:hypothetical protein